MALQDNRADSSLGDGLGTLKRIPEEIRLKVFECLVPERLPTGTDSDLSSDILDSRKALLSLCSTSKKCYALALPFLYKHVIITDYTQMASLLVTLMYKKERRAWIHRLAVLVEFEIDVPHWYKIEKNCILMEETIDRLEEYDIENQESSELKTFNALGELLHQLHDKLDETPVAHSDGPPDSDEDSPYFTDNYSWRRYETAFNGVYCGHLQILLQMQINLKDILITVIPDFTHLLCPAEMHGRIMEQFQLYPTEPSPENPLKNLLSIRKQSDPNRMDCFDPDPLAPEYLGSTDWEFFRDSGNWFFDGFLDKQGWPCPRPPPSDLTIFSHITDLGLYNSKTHPAQLRVILSFCKSLEILSYTTKLSSRNRFRPLPSTDEDEGVAVPTLQQAMDEVKGKLKELRLGWSGRGHVLTDAEEEAVAPHKVDISGFPHLTKVDIDRAFDARPVSEEE